MNADERGWTRKKEDEMEFRTVIVTLCVGALLIQSETNARPHVIEPNYWPSQEAMWSGNNNNVMDNFYIVRSGRNS